MKPVIVIVSAVMFFSISVFGQEITAPFQIIRSNSGLSLHKEMFMLPVTFSNEYNSEQTEAVFRLSAKHQLFGSRFYFAYTQISFWQAYDHKHSAPFRETNYNPEIFYRTKPFAWGNCMLGMDIGFEHESNGQQPPISRSWNLFYFSPYYYRSNLLVQLKIRYRIPEDEKEYPDAFVGDDNPDILSYYGYTDFHFYYKIKKGYQLHLLVRGNIDTSRGYVSGVFTFPVPKSTQSLFMFRATHGYGESMVDYKIKLTRIGFGITFMQD